MIINNLELPDVSIRLHESKETNDEFGDRSNEDLLFAFPFGVDDGFEAICQNIHLDHRFTN